MSSQAEAIANAQKVYAALRPIELSDIPVADIKDRLSLLTVAGGVRNVGAIGFGDSDNEGNLRRLRDALINCGLRNTITEHPLPHNDHLAGEFSREVLQVFYTADVEDQSRKNNRLLWVYSDQKDLERIRMAATDGEMIGIVLGYPECCVRREVEHKRNFSRAFVRAIVDAVGPNPKNIEAALKKNLEVQVPDEVVVDRNMPKTDRQYPFLLHTACDSCLEREESASAKMNADYERLAADIDLSFHHALLDLIVLDNERAELLGMDTSTWKIRDDLIPEEQERLADFVNRSQQVIERFRRS